MLCVDKVESLAATDRDTAREAAEALFAAEADAIPCLLANANDHRPYHGECWQVGYAPGYPKNSSDFEDFTVIENNWIFEHSEEEMDIMIKESKERRRSTASISEISLFLIVAILKGDLMFAESCVPVYQNRVTADVSSTLIELEKALSEIQPDDSLDFIRVLDIAERHGIRYRPARVSDSTNYIQGNTTGYWISCYQAEIVNLINCTFFDRVSGRIVRRGYYATEPKDKEWKYGGVEYDYYDGYAVHTKNDFRLEPAGIESLYVLVPSECAALKRFVDLVESWGGEGSREAPLHPWVVKKETSTIFLTRDMSPAAYYDEQTFAEISQQLGGVPAAIIIIDYRQIGGSEKLAKQFADATVKALKGKLS
jgi:hypothetical protein